MFSSSIYIIITNYYPQIEKVFAKVRFMPDIDPDKLDAFFEATEDW